MKETSKFMFNENIESIFQSNKEEIDFPELKKTDLHSYEFVAFKPESIPDDLTKNDYIDIDDLIKYAEEKYYILLPIDSYESSEIVKKKIDQYKKKIFILFYNVDFYKNLIVKRFNVSKESFQIIKKTEFIEYKGQIVDALRVKNLNRNISTDIKLYSSDIVDIYLINRNYKKYIISNLRRNYEKKILLTDPVFTYEFLPFILADEKAVKYYKAYEPSFDLLVNRFKSKVIYTKDEFVDFYFDFSNKTRTNLLKNFFNKVVQADPEILIYIRPVLKDEM